MTKYQSKKGKAKDVLFQQLQLINWLTFPPSLVLLFYNWARLRATHEDSLCRSNKGWEVNGREKRTGSWTNLTILIGQKDDQNCTGVCKSRLLSIYLFHCGEPWRSICAQHKRLVLKKKLTRMSEWWENTVWVEMMIGWKKVHCWPCWWSVVRLSRCQTQCTRLLWW